MTLEEFYRRCERTPSDIVEHLQTLKCYASACEHVTEFGTRAGISTAAFLMAQPKELHCYDIERHPNVSQLIRIRGKTRFVFHLKSTFEAEIEPTELLFIDTLHTYKQLNAELTLHGNQAARYLIFHDITTFGCRNEIKDGSRFHGLLPAISRFLRANPHWTIDHASWNCHGLMVLKRA